VWLSVCLSLSNTRLLGATQGEKSNSQISDEERAFRQQEANLLDKISAAPIFGEDCLKQLVAEKKAQNISKTKK
jgi:hypothetical protein